jgi:prepilin-type N-terminal cleavage/methylation domain-containing protein
MKNECQRSREGFSLTELLVVIAVIGLLVGLLLPALAFARFRSRVTVCVGQFKQLALASNLYATDNKRGFLPAFTLPTATSKLTNYNSIEPWFVALPMITSLEHYGVTPRMWFCPTRRRWTDANEFFRWKSGNREISSAADLIAYYGYQGSPMAGLDMFWWVPRPLEGLGTTKFPDPTLIKSRDSDPWPEKSEDVSAATKPIASDWLGAAWDTETGAAYAITGAHTFNGAIRSDNLAFADGHVETRPYSKVRWQCINVRGQFAYLY